MKSNRGTVGRAVLFVSLIVAAGCSDDDANFNTSIRGTAVAVFPNGDQARRMVVCVQDTFCDDTNDSGFFVLDGPFSGTETLVFSGPAFSADLTLFDIPAGRIINLNNVVCFTDSGDCVLGGAGVPTVPVTQATAIRTATAVTTPSVPATSVMTTTPATPGQGTPTASRSAGVTTPTGSPSPTGPVPSTTPTGTGGATQTPTPIATGAETPTAVATGAETPTPVATDVETPTPTASGGPELTVSPTPSPIVTEVPTETPGETPTETPAETPTETPGETSTETPTETPTP